jgi:hypothetical protein
VLARETILPSHRRRGFVRDANANMETVFSDSPGLVIPIYVIVVLPLGLYLAHDVMDARFRRVQFLNFISLLYIIYFLLAGGAITLYVVYQGIGEDFKEVGASIVALLLASYGFWKLLRLQRILGAHHRLISTVVVPAEKALCTLTNDGRIRTFEIDYFDRPLTHYIPSDKGQPLNRYTYLASSIFGTCAVRFASFLCSADFCMPFSMHPLMAQMSSPP